MSFIKKGYQPGCLPCNGGGGGGTEVLTFGSLDADYRSWAKLPEAGPGTLAMDVRSGSFYAATEGFGKTWWLPAGAEWEVIGGLYGDEANETELNSNGMFIVSGSGGTLTYLPSGEQGLEVSVSGSEFWNMSTADKAGDGFDASTPACIISDAYTATSSGSFSFTKALLFRQDRQMRLGSSGGGLVERFRGAGGVTVSEQSNWQNAINTFVGVTENDHLELCSADGRTESRINGQCYIAAPDASFVANSGSTWDCRIGPSTPGDATVRILRWVAARRLS